jgi:dienelactone hydrolase
VSEEFLAMPLARRLLALLLIASCSPALAQGTSEQLSFPQEFRGKAIMVSGELFLPPGADKVPALVIHHGSGGVSEARELRYAREIVQMGVATLVIDSFKPRGITSTVRDQSTVTGNEMLADEFAALKALAAHARIDGKRVGVIGFSKGGTAALLAAHEGRAARALPGGPRFALHIPVYPSCLTQHYKPKSTGAPIYFLLGGADTYVGHAVCEEYAAALKAQGARVEVTVYPGAQHGFDGGQTYNVPQGENYSRCVFVQQPDGSWQERVSGITTMDAKGQPNEEANKRALAACRTLGVSGAPDPEARTKSMAALKSYVQRHLLDGK